MNAKTGVKWQFNGVSREKFHEKSLPFTNSYKHLNFFTIFYAWLTFWWSLTRYTLLNIAFAFMREIF
jgi:hypothetical protein